MKRRFAKLACRILLFVLLGAILNFAVAWGFAWLSDPMKAAETDYEFPHNRAKIHILVWRNVGRTLIYYPGYSDPHGRPFVSPRVPDAIPWYGGRDVSSYQTGMPSRNFSKPPLREAFGWPSRSLWCEHLYSSGTWIPGTTGGIKTRSVWSGPNNS